MYKKHVHVVATPGVCTFKFKSKQSKVKDSKLHMCRLWDEDVHHCYKCKGHQL